MDVFNPIPTAILDWMESTWLNRLMLDMPWSWVVAETLHFTGMCLLFGPILIMDLRLMGIGRRVLSAPSTHLLVQLALTGFAINLITGILFLFGLPYRYAVNISFQIKMILVMLAGVNAIYFWYKASRVLDAAGPHEAPSLELKFVGATSLLLWTAVISFGRMIPYLGTG